MSYTKRTCHKCGYRDIQPNMKQIEIEYVSGSSQAELSGRAVATAAIFGSKKGGNQVANWLTGNTKRQYKRKKLVWVCYSNCGKKHNTSQTPPKKASPRLTKEEKELIKLEKQLADIQQQISDEVRLAEATAKIKELELLERQNMTTFDKFLELVKSFLYWTFWFAVGVFVMNLFL